MVVDTSVLVAILFNEPFAEDLEAAIANDPVRLISAATLIEAATVVESRLGEGAGKELDSLLEQAGFEVIAVDEDQARIARQALRVYGKGRHPAALNFGDCFPYALSKVTNEPLLFKGEDFSLTDVRAALS